MSAAGIVTESQGRPGDVYVPGFPPSVAVLPDGRRIRLGGIVTGSYTRHNDIRGRVIGWTSEVVVVAPDGPGSSFELGPEDILSIEEWPA